MGCGQSTARPPPSIGTLPLPAEVRAYVPTPAQQAAAATAAAAQRRVHAAAEAAPAEVKDKVGSVWASDIGGCGGPAFEELLKSCILIDAQFLIALAEAGGVVPRWQDLPHEAAIGPNEAWRLRCWDRMFKLPVLVLSYPWLDAIHPDREGEQLRRLLPIFKAMVAEAKKYGEHATVGVLQDYVCLPQRPYRSAEEEARFKLGLRSMNAWYTHPHTIVLLVTTPLPTGAEYTNRDRPYHSRGWCFVEQRLSGLVKYDDCMWDLSAHDGSEMDFEGLQRKLKAGRLPPLSPDHVARELREGVESGAVAFTSASDVDVVIELYTKGFVAAIDDHAYNSGSDRSATGSLFYTNLGWGDEEAPAIAEALAYAAAHCTPSSMRTFYFHGNQFSVEAQQTFEAACAGSELFEVLH